MTECVELDNFEQFIKGYSAYPDWKEWTERVGEFNDSGVGTDTGEIPLINHVWSLDESTE